MAPRRPAQQPRFCRAAVASTSPLSSAGPGAGVSRLHSSLEAPRAPIPESELGPLLRLRPRASPAPIPGPASQLRLRSEAFATALRVPARPPVPPLTFARSRGPGASAGQREAGASPGTDVSCLSQRRPRTRSRVSGFPLPGRVNLPLQSLSWHWSIEKLSKAFTPCLLLLSQHHKGFQSKNFEKLVF